MKIKYIFSIIVLLLGANLCCLIKNNNCRCNSFAAENQNNNENYQVTFIELGSIRCIPCKMMQPVMEDIKKEYTGTVKVVFHDVWTPEGEPYAKKYGIDGIPTQIFLDKEGKEFFRHIGFFAKNQIVKVLEKKGIQK